MLVIAKSKNDTKGSIPRAARVLVLATACLSTISCTSSLDLFGSVAKVDRSISTGTVADSNAATALSDEATVRNAVTSADLAKIGTSPLPWANAATGSAGVVSEIRETQGNGQVCRDFTTTRHSYGGIAIFTGRACLTGSGEWLLTAFDRQ